MQQKASLILHLFVLCLLLGGCGKDQNDTPPAPTEPSSKTITQTPVQVPEVHPTDPPDDPLAGLPEEDRQFIEDHTDWLDTMGYVLEEDGYTTLDVILLEEGVTDAWLNSEIYHVWRAGAGIPGRREIQRLVVLLTPDGKDFTIQVMGDPVFDDRCKAVQNYLLLQTDLMGGGGTGVLTGLGFDPAQDVPYTDFYAAMMRLVTPELYRHHFAQYFTEQDGKVVPDTLQETAVSPLLLDALSQNDDGSWLAEYHGFYAPGNLWPRKANVILDTLPDGNFVVAGWECLE